MGNNRRYGRLAALWLLFALWGLALPALAQTGSITWSEDLAAGQLTNLRLEQGALRLGELPLQLRYAGRQRHTGDMLFAPRRFKQPLGRFLAEVDAHIPAGALVLVELRARSAGRWSEWRIVAELSSADQEQAGASPVETPWPSAEIQARLSLLDDGAGQGPRVRGLRLSGEPVAAQFDAGVQAPLTYTIFATREGLVGNYTSNGHLIVECDRFVALPSLRGRSSYNGYEYQVHIYYPKTGKSVVAPVWDVGPWNTKDDYWNPSAVREMWQDLPQGKPEAQAARLEGYNGGKDMFGRTVQHPNGIDIADGTFWTDLGMVTEDWVEVTYLWTGSSLDQQASVLTTTLDHSLYLPLIHSNGWESTVDNISCGQLSASANWLTSSYNQQNYGGNYRYANPEPVSDAAWFKASIPETGVYEVQAWYPASAAYNSSTPYVIVTTEGNQVVRVNQQQDGGRWVSLGSFTLAAGSYNVVGVSRWSSAPGYVIADALRLIQR